MRKQIATLTMIMIMVLSLCSTMVSANNNNLAATNDVTNTNAVTENSNQITFINNGEAGSAGFSPLFAIDKPWSTNFAGEHKTFINLPWNTTLGTPQRGLLTLHIGYQENANGQKEKYVYMRINFPLNPMQPFHHENNPYFWAASSIATESSPYGGLYINSVTSAKGGVDGFQATKFNGNSASLNLTMTLVAPDQAGYQEYGQNYASAGNGILPKTMTVSVNLNNIATQAPVASFGRADVTFTDANGVSATSPSTKFQSSLFLLPEQPQI